ncbi:MAG: hypothetical protein UU73_C0001G0001, partial [Candidatus Daviesbacteria bacterium GW2011_GWA1_41_61]
TSAGPWRKICTDGDTTCIAGSSGGYWTLSGNNLYPTTIGNNVGIGTTSPQSKLDVIGTLEVGTGTRGVQLTSTAPDNFQLMTQTNTPNTNWQIGTGNGSGAFDITKPYIASNGYISMMAGNVGIGTTSPQRALTIVAPSNAWTMTVQNAAKTNEGFLIGFDASGNTVQQLGDTSNVSKIYLNTAGNSYLNGGNVGIGTTNPTTKLDIGGSTIWNGVTIRSNAGGVGYIFNDNNFHIEANNYLWINGDTSAPTEIGYGGGNTILNRSSGNVGIGTVTPYNKLDVAGNLGMRDNDIYFRGTGGVDGNHGVGFYGGPGKLWGASDDVNGPVLYGYKLEVNGQVKITGGSPGAGKVLTSDATGLATWQVGGGGSSVLATFNGGRSDLCDNCSQTNVSGSLTAPASGMLTLDYSLLMDSPYCGIIISTYIDGVRIREQNVKGCFGPLKAGNSDCPDAQMPSQAFIYKAAVSAGSHSFNVNGWTGGGACGNTRGFQVSPAYFQWQP